MAIDVLIITCSAILLLAVITAIIRLKLTGHNALSGASPIPLGLLIAGKSAMALSILIMVVNALGLHTGPQSPAQLQVLAVLLLAAGLGFAVPSLFQLGEELRFGLSGEPSMQLKSTGLYRISRNPLYLGFYLVAIASCLYAPYWFNAALALVAVAIHHRVVLAEENFLGQRFGRTYDRYTQQVRRYL